MKKLFLTLILSGTAFAQNKNTKLEEVAQFGNNQPIGVAVQTSTNRVFVSFPHNEPFLYAVTEIKNGKRVPYPNDAWNWYMPGQPESHFVSVQDMYADEKGCLWILDSKPAGDAAMTTDGGDNKVGKFKLVKINLATNTVEKVYNFSNLDKTKSGLNDVRIDNSRNLAYLSDPAQSAIVILDLTTDTVRLVLQGDKSTMAVNDYILKLDGRDMIDDTGKPFSSNVNGIALTKDNKYFYYKPINEDKLFRIETRYLADASLTAKQLSYKVETVATTGPTHGLECDTKGNIYFGHSPSHSIKYVSTDGKVHTLITDDHLMWPDSFGIGSDGYLYFSVVQFNRKPKYNQGTDRVNYPYKAYRVQLPE